MAATRDPQTTATHHSILVVALAAVGMMAAAATAHLSPAPSISAAIVMTSAGLLAIRASPRKVLAGGSALAATSGIAGYILFDGTALDAASAAFLVALTCLLAGEVAKRVRAMAGPRAGQAHKHLLDDRYPAEPPLLELARSTLGQMEPAEVEASLEALIEALDCDAITLWQNADAQGTLRGNVVCWAGLPAVTSDGILWARAPSVTTCFSTGRPHVFSDVNHVPSPDRAIYRRLGFTAAVEFPVMVNGKWVGHVTLACRAGIRTWEQQEIDAVEVVADLIAARWERSAAVQQMERVVAQRDRSLLIQRAISESARMIFEADHEELGGVLKLVLSSLGGDAAFLMNVRNHDEHGPGLETAASALAPGTQIPDHLQTGAWITTPVHYIPATTGETMIMSDIEDLGPEAQAWYAANMPKARAAMLFPIVSNDSVVGVIGMASSRSRVWEAAEMRTLSTIAQMIGVARTRGDARRGLEEVVKAKDSFIASVSHELRTPMAVVMGLSSELDARWSDFSQEEVTEFIDLIARESRAVSHIIEDLLIAARASAESITVLPELIRLDEVVAEAIAGMPLDTTHRLTSSSLAEVATLADPLRVRQIVRNLVANSHRHGGSRIYVTVAERDGVAVLEVADDGPGIPLERRDRIFEAYEVGETSGRTASIGLGLTVSRQLARLMGGDVVYDPDPMPTFRLSLPVGAVPEHTRLRAIAS